MELPLGATFSNYRNAVPGNTTITSNTTELIELIASYENQVLQPSGASVVLFQVQVNATTQVCTSLVTSAQEWHHDDRVLAAGSVQQICMLTASASASCG